MRRIDALSSAWPALDLRSNPITQGALGRQRGVAASRHEFSDLIRFVLMVNYSNNYANL
jgi:hypothetical protein